MDDNERDLGLSLIETMRSSDLQKIGQDALELAIDQLLEPGILRQIPIVSTIARISSTSRAVRDVILAKKLLRFLVCLDKVTEKIRDKFVAKMLLDPKHARTVGENIMLIIDKLNDMRKPDMVAAVFCAYLSDAISLEDFLAMANAIERANYQALAEMLDFHRWVWTDFAQQSGEIVEENVHKHYPDYDDRLWRELFHSGLAVVQLQMTHMTDHELAVTDKEKELASRGGRVGRPKPIKHVETRFAPSLLAAELSSIVLEIPRRHDAEIWRENDEAEVDDVHSEDEGPDAEEDE